MTDLEASEPTGSVAIIGMSGRFPGASSVEQLWQNLANGVESISFFSDDELRAAGADPAITSQKNYVKAGGVLDSVEWFDASFFGFNPREAETMDPQHRLFLECSWEALEAAGYDPWSFTGLIGVYAGAAMSTYGFNLLSAARAAVVDEFQFTIGNDKDYLTTRVSYKLNLRGPSVTVQTACSTSLVAVTLACQGLLNYQCDLALAGGVGISIPQKRGYLYREGGILSPDGHCRAFDAAGRGIVGGNGVGIVALKRLEDALADGDWIRAVIRGSALNNDGSGKIGYTAPAVDGQAQVIAMAQAIAGISPETISYVEAHGTGTQLGDPIEIAALTQVFRAATARKGFCAIGSVKSNIGHLDPAAGVAGLIKTVLALENKLLPPSLHFLQPNPNIDFANSPFFVNTTPREWPAGPTPRRAGVSSFGIGGTNAHVVLEEAPALETSKPSRPWHLLTLSAKSASALEAATDNLVAHLKQHPEIDLADVAYVQHVGRAAFNHRRMLVCERDDLTGATGILESRSPNRVLTSIHELRSRAVRFMFPGQGSQYVNMTRELYDVEPVFREQLDRCAEVLEPALGVDLRTVLYPDAERGPWASDQLNQTKVTQPALFAVEYALAKLWMAWGVTPQAMLGHSIGEYVAACLAGVFSLEDALSLVAARGRLMDTIQPGLMLALPISAEYATELIGDRLSVAVANTPSLCVVAGPTDDVTEFEASLARSGIEGRRVQTSHAFHSAMMDPILDAFTEEVRQVTLHPPRMPYVSNVTGTWVTAELVTDPPYWARHLRQTVRFDEGLRELMKDPDCVLLEVGPGQTLTRFAKAHSDKAFQQLALPSVRQARDNQSDCAVLLGALGQLWLGGIQVDWKAFHAHERRQRIPLPTYPFERARYWIEPQTHASPASFDFLPTREALEHWFYTPAWKLTPVPVDPGPSAPPTRARWLLFGDDCGLASQMALQLRDHDRDVVVVTAAGQFAHESEHAYALNPTRREDYDVLIEELCTSDRCPEVIVHLWSVTGDERRVSDVDAFNRAQDFGFNSLLRLAQSIGRNRITTPIRIGIVSNQMQSVTGDEQIDPAKATLIGPCRVIPQEYPNISCQSIDIVLPDGDPAAEARLAQRIIAELGDERAEPVVAYRGSRRCAMGVDVLKLPDAAHASARLRERGVYLITGGLGGIGLVLGRYLAETVRARLVLTSRSGVPPREEWEERLVSPEQSGALNAVIRQLLELEERGSEVLVIRADVADRQQMTMAIEQALTRFGVIHGIVHCAGVAGGGMIQPKTPEMAARIVAPKVQGLLVLDDLFETMPLDFLVICSSLASMVGGLGQVDYCAANAFLDAFAHRAGARDGRTTIVINWDTWQEVGMTVNTPVPRELEEWRAATLKDGIRPAEGTEAFARILSSPVPQVAVSTKNLHWVMATAMAAPSLEVEQPLQQAVEPPAATSRHPRPNVTTAYEAPRNDVERTIAATWEGLLGIEGIGIHDSFFELGGHSLLAIQVNSRLSDAFKLELSVQDIFDAPTIATLASTIEKATQNAYADTEDVAKVLEQVEQLSEDEVKSLLMARGRADH